MGDDAPVTGDVDLQVQSDLARAIEAILFVTDEPVASSVLAGALDADRSSVDAACDELARAHEERGSGLALRNVAGGWRLFTHPDVAPLVERFILSTRQARLTRASLETLAIVAYKQPVTRHQISSIRGVNADGVLKALVDRELVAEVGRDEGPGRPVLYGTTPTFLERLGLPSLSSLPSLAPLLGIDAAADADGDAVADADDDLPTDSGDDHVDDADDHGGEADDGGAGGSHADG
jgi:segregation and condensation protein B